MSHVEPITTNFDSAHAILGANESSRRDSSNDTKLDHQFDHD